MKMLHILIFVFLANSTFSEPITLKQCYDSAKTNYPLLKQNEVYGQIYNSKVKNLNVNYLPTMDLNAQATFQSDVTKMELNLPIQEFKSPDEMSKFQYKAEVSINQSIWDASLTKANKELEKALLKSNLQDVNVKLFAINNDVNSLFFNILKLDKNYEILKLKQKILEEKLKVISSKVKNEYLTKISEDIMKYELLSTLNQITETKFTKKSMLNSLSLFTKMSFSDSSIFVMPNINAVITEQIGRPELTLFDLKKEELNKSSGIVGKKRLPQVFGFGKVGYGLPGLNMLKTNAETYYMIGVGVKWNIYDWDKSKREKKNLKFSQDMIDIQRDEFLLKLSVALEQNIQSIEKLAELIKSDAELIEIRKDITKVSASQLENGVISADNYVETLNTEMQTRLQYELRLIQYAESCANYNTLKGIEN